MNASAIKMMLKRSINAPFHALGYEVRQRVWHGHAVPGCAGLYPRYAEEAKRADMDVNDWLEQELKWTGGNEILKRDVLPYVRDNSVVCELGPGTGRSTRKILERLPKGELHLVDCGDGFVDFLKSYFRSDRRVRIHQNDGSSLPFFAPSCLDVIYSIGTFTQLPLSSFYLYSKEFFRVLKPGGYLIVEYVDAMNAEGWALLEAQSSRYGINDFFTYYSPELVEKIFSSAGFNVIENDNAGQWLPGHPYRVVIARREAETHELDLSAHGS